jgi:endonuclease YncB( thermonuclease family)
MQKFGLLLLSLMLLPIAQSFAAEKEEIAAKPAPIQMEFDRKTQIRSTIPLKIKKAIDATSILEQNGDIYTLTGIDIPNDNDTESKTQKRLIELTEGKKCTLYQTRSDKVGRINRMNHILGHLTCGKDDIWIQGTLVAEGLARVRTTPENKEQYLKLLELEKSARDKELGLWAIPMNTTLTPLTASQNMNNFAIVEAQVYATAQNKQSIFLNFTSDWKTDFSVAIPAKLRKDFSKLRIDPMSLRGKKIRVRGWIRSYNGPYIELDHAEQLELVTDTQPEKKNDDKAEKIIEEIMDAPTPQEKPSPKANTQQFMHTIKGPSAPVVEEPVTEKPEPPKIEKKENVETN